MAMTPVRGALIEYSGEFLGPIPNVVVFQFNPETIARTITIPGSRASESNAANRPRSETHATEAPPVESFSITAVFSASDDLGRSAAMARAFGVGPQLAALEKMVYPPATPGGIVGAAIDAIGDAIGGGTAAAEEPVPREQLPRILFVWGPSRVLPVRITSMTITEKQYDALLNPIEAEVQIGLAVSPDPPPDDPIGAGAFQYSRMVKDTQATLNLANTVQYAVDLVPF